MRNADGQIVHVNIEDISQFLTYHEVFGKISNSEHPFPTTSNALTMPPNSHPSSSLVPTSINQSITQSASTPLIIPKIENQAITSSAGSSASVSTTSTPTCVSASSSDADQAAMPAPALHTCDICGKVFPFKYQFIVHRRYHNERKPFICQVCGQAFTTSVDLTSHGKIHDGVKMFTCNICYNVFATDASLERHMKRHSTDKPFGCTVCQKTFARKVKSNYFLWKAKFFHWFRLLVLQEHLDNHFRSHTGETPFR